MKGRSLKRRRRQKRRQMRLDMHHKPDVICHSSVQVRWRNNMCAGVMRHKWEIYEIKAMAVKRVEVVREGRGMQSNI